MERYAIMADRYAQAVDLIDQALDMFVVRGDLQKSRSTLKALAAQCIAADARLHR